ncbi:BspA family leucine-rich repeat surface protein [Flagellimonas oceanensis]|uniref:BspA family leucine-rich repeat surface protein n=1 Tax=Flagellimonas oceanensis TaxID=2499163 RepID=UPI000F8E1F5F|nr:BspA family leucine-rich repeat surface protein [Allomuricauda oceanensis]
MRIKNYLYVLSLALLCLFSCNSDDSDGGTPPITYTVSFDTGEGSTVEDQIVEEGGTAIRPEDPTRDGYSFEGWYKDEALTTAFDFTTEVTEDLTLYAKWEIITYTITFDTGEGSAVEDQIVEHGGTATRPEDPIRDGFSFEGWFTEQELTTEFDFATEVIEDLTLYAKWEEIITYTVSFDTDEGSAVEDQIVEEGGTATRPEDPTRDGYSFEGWFTEQALTTEFDFTTEVTEDLTLYAKWEEIITYTVSFDTDEGSAVEDQTVEEGATATRPEDPTRNGYSFEEWYTDEALTTEFDFATEVTENLTLFAKWMFLPANKAALADLLDSGTDPTLINTRLITDMSFLSLGSSFNGDISGWDVSNVTNMREMFRDATSFNGDISGWDVSKVTDMAYLFDNATSFDQNLSGWDVSNVTNMRDMFRAATSFNGDLSGWDVSSVTTMREMFQNATSFNGDLSGWDVSNVTDMYQMFRETPFNGDISGWSVSNVTNIEGMFRDATSFDQDLSGWNVSNVTDMAYIFRGATSFNGNISGWNVSNVTNMREMFRDATSFNGDISGWDVSKVTDMAYLFDNATSFDQNLSGWDVSNVTNMRDMFRAATSFNGDLSGWDVSNVTNMQNMFQNAASFDQDLSGWDVSGKNTTNMFLGATAMQEAHYPQGL